MQDAVPPKTEPKIVPVEKRVWGGTHRIFDDRTKANIVLFCGVGFGKTQTLCEWIVNRAVQRCESSRCKKSVLIGPSHNILKREHYPRIRRILYEIGLRQKKDYDFHATDRVIEFGRKLRGYQIFLASMERYDNFVTWEFDDGAWDEPGWGDEELKMEFDNRVGRVAVGHRGQRLYGGVVQYANWYLERFGPKPNLITTKTYKLPLWVNDYAPGWGGKEFSRYREDDRTLCVHGASYENRTLNPEYFHDLWESYGWKESRFRAHVLGEAIAITTLAVYDSFEMEASVGDYPPDFDGRTECLDACFDFNYGRMAVACMQSYWGGDYVVWENERDDLATTKEAAEAFVARFPSDKFGDREVRVFGDQAGWARNPQVKSIDGSYGIIESILKGKYRKVTFHAPYDTIPQDTRVMSTNKYHALAVQNKGIKRSRGLFADRSCRKVVNGWQSVSWDAQKGKISKPANDMVTHWAEAVDYRMYVVYPPVGVQTTWTRRRDG